MRNLIKEMNKYIKICGITENCYSILSINSKNRFFCYLCICCIHVGKINTKALKIRKNVVHTSFLFCNKDSKIFKIFFLKYIDI